VIPRFITSALLHEPLTIHGTGVARRDWLYVEDTCERIDLIMHHDIDQIRGEVFNLGSGFDLDVLSIAKTILRFTNRPESLIVFISDRPGQVQHHVSCTTKAENLFGLKQGRSFEEGLELTIKWYADHRSWWEKQLSMRRVSIMTKDGATHYH